MTSFAPALKRLRPAAEAPAMLLQRKCTACGSHKPLGGNCAACDKEDRVLQRRSLPASNEGLGDTGQAPPIVHEVLRSAGRPLSESARAFFEPRFGHDFSAVRVHADARAAASARAVDAEAYTVGNNIAFAAGRWSAAAADGLLAHELAHVVQQSRGTGPLGNGPLRVSEPGGATEQDADRVAHAVMSGRPASLDHRTGPQLFRRATTVERVAPPDESAAAGAPGAPAPLCGPDITDWFIKRANSKMSDPLILSIKLNLLSARMLLPWTMSSEMLAEGATAAAVLAKEKSLGAKAPPRDAEANKQLAHGTESLTKSALSGTATSLMVPGGAARIAQAMIYMGIAAATWGAMVTHGTEYDFKKRALKRPKAGSCPGELCTSDYGVVTICPGGNGFNCYETDAPGNIFYSLVGKYAGWNRETIKLGSQLAELMDDKREKMGWDSAEDVVALDVGHNLKLPLDQGSFCSQVRSAGSHLNYKSACRDCPTPFSEQGDGK